MKRFLPAFVVILLALGVSLALFCERLEGQDNAAKPAPTPQISPDTPEVDLPKWAPEWFPEWSLKTFFGMAVWQYLAAFVLVLLGLVLRKVNDHVFDRRIIPLLEKTSVHFDNMLAEAAGKPLGVLYLLGGLAGAFAVLTLPREPNVHGFAFGAVKVLLGANLVWFLFRCVDVMTHYLEKLAGRTDSDLDDQLVPVIRKSLKVTISIIVSVWIIQLFGYSVSGLIAGLGIGGLAVALALQDTLANFFGSIFIFIDRPFKPGDWIEVEGVEGVVEKVGFRSTRIRTFPKTLVSIPNKTMAAAKIDNFQRMPKRRVLQSVGVTYETTPEQMERAVADIRKILENDPGVDQEFIVVRFTDFADSSLNITVLYFTIAIPFADHVEVKERVNLAIMRALENLNLSIAFPTQTLYLEGEVAKRLADNSGADEPKKDA